MVLERAEEERKKLVKQEQDAILSDETCRNVFDILQLTVSSIPNTMEGVSIKPAEDKIVGKFIKRQVVVPGVKTITIGVSGDDELVEAQISGIYNGNGDPDQSTYFHRFQISFDGYDKEVYLLERLQDGARESFLHLTQPRYQRIGLTVYPVAGYTENPITLEDAQYLSARIVDPFTDLLTEAVGESEPTP